MIKDEGIPTIKAMNKAVNNTNAPVGMTKVIADPTLIVQMSNTGPNTAIATVRSNNTTGIVSVKPSYPLKSKTYLFITGAAQL